MVLTPLLAHQKLKEIKAVAKHCTIIRKGKGIGTVVVDEVTEQDLADLMVGRKVTFKLDKDEVKVGAPILEVENLCVKNNRGVEALKQLSLTVREGEILGVAGIEGNGQTELIEAITGLKPADSGTVKLAGKDISKMSVRKRTEEGIGHIPEDRHKHGLVLEYSLEDNCF